MSVLTASPRSTAPIPARVQVGRLLGTGAAGLLIGLLIWETAGRVFDLTFLPPASAVIGRLIELFTSGQVLPILMASLGSLAIGLAISLTGGVLIGMLMGVSEGVAAALDPVVNAMLTAPSLVFAPIFFSIWGIGRESIVALIVTYSLFVVIVNTSAAVRAVPAGLHEMARSFNATPFQVFRFVTIPSATPLTLAGVRLGTARAVKGMVNGEMFIALIGLGKLIRDAQHQLDATTVLAVLAIAVIISLTLMALVEMVDAHLTRWLPATMRGT
jgi:NitT/TauT family transport system permease protein